MRAKVANRTTINTSISIDWPRIIRAQMVRGACNHFQRIFFWNVIAHGGNFQKFMFLLAKMKALQVV